jgi:putative restriction endonuclease
MPEIKQRFTDYLNVHNKPGSKKADSYIRALEWQEEMIKSVPQGFNEFESIWQLHDLDRIAELYQFVIQESKSSSTLWNIDGIPRSYLKKGFCSAALAKFHQFLMEYLVELNALQNFDLIDVRDRKIEYKPNYKVLSENLGDLSLAEGSENTAQVKVRVNQSAFRTMVLNNFNQTCCITGLRIPQLNRASHIVGWAERSDSRLDPRNGLCLSATYDAAFDRHLIGLDDDYRLILSKDLKYYSLDVSFKECFLSIEGKRIQLPTQYMPRPDYIEYHRNKGSF